jgi:hypothetical protein
MSRFRFTSASITFAVFASIALLTGCTPTGDTVADKTPVATPTETITASPTAEPTPEPTLAPVAATCENLVNPGSTVGVENPEYVLKIRGSGSPLALFDEYGGILCLVGGALEVYELYGYSPITPAQQSVQETRLSSEGLTASSVDGGTLYIDSTDAQDVVKAFYFRNGFWWCGYDVARITEIVANSPAS